MIARLGGRPALRLLFAGLISLSWPSLAAAPPPTQAVRFFFPTHNLSRYVEQALVELLTEYNTLNPGTPAELVRKPGDYSTLRELGASQLADELPDIAGVEPSDLAPLQERKLLSELPAGPLRPLLQGMPAWALKQTRTTRGKPALIPFARTAPALFLDQETLFRAHENPDLIPTSWSALEKLLKKLLPSLDSPRQQYVMAIPLQGPRGLWIFEALTAKPIWRREAGGLKANRELESQLRALLSLLDRPQLVRTEETWEKNVQAFLDRKVPVLIGSLDLVPHLKARAAFRWTAHPLPILGGKTSSRLAAGTDLLVLRDRPEVWKFLSFLYAPKQAARWLEAGAFLPLRPDWASAAGARLPALAKQLRTDQVRTTDPELMRARAVLIQLFSGLFSTDPSSRPPVEDVFRKLDQLLNLPSSE